MWTSQIWWRQRIQRMKMFRAFFCWNIDDTRKGSGVWANSVTTDGKHLVNHLIIIQQVQDHMCLIRSLEALSLSNTKKNIVIFTNIWRCQTDSNSLDSMLCLNLLPSVLLSYRQSEDKASCPWLLLHPILADLQTFLSFCISPFEQLVRKLHHCPDQRPFTGNCCQGALWLNTNIVSGWHFSGTINKALRTNNIH